MANFGQKLTIKLKRRRRRRGGDEEEEKELEHEEEAEGGGVGKKKKKRITEASIMTRSSRPRLHTYRYGTEGYRS